MRKKYVIKVGLIMFITILLVFWWEISVKAAEEQPLSDGIYEIEVGVDSNKVLDVIDAEMWSGANVQIFTKNNANCQKVQVTYIGDGYYSLTFIHSGKVLDVSNGMTENHTNVWQCNSNGSDAQKWIIKDAGNGYYNIISKLSNTYLTVANGGTRNCTNIEINTKLDNASQKFKFNKLEKIQGTKTIEDGTYEIETGVDENKTLDVIDAEMWSGANVQIFTKNNANCQKVNIKYQGNGYYTLEFVHSRKLLDVSDGKIENHTNVWQCNSNGSDAQKWIIQDAGNGYYNIISKLSNTYLTVANGETRNCTNVEINTKLNNTSQKFKFNEMEKIEAKKSLDTGLYEIETGVDENKALDVIDALNYSGANVQIFTKNKAKCQKVIVEYLENGYYELTFLHSGKKLDVANAGTENHTNVWQCNSNGSDAQKWIIKDAGNGYYNIISKLSNTYLTVANGETRNCTNIEINSKLDNNSQRFKFNKLDEVYGLQTISDGLYEIETGVDSNKVLDVIDANTYSGANVQIFTRNNANCQKVQVAYIGDGYYNLTFIHSGKVLDVSNGMTSDHTNVWQCNTNGSDAQTWVIRDLHNGYYNIISKLSNTYLTVANGENRNCANIEINSKLSDNSQKFKFNRTKISGEEGVYGFSGLSHKGDSRGSQLKYYKYGFGNNVLFATFAVHGFEDNWYRDGQALTEIANHFYNKLVSDSDIYIAKNWTVYIFPSVNPDGEYYGDSNNGPGRRTLYSWAPQNKGIDINRSWQCRGMTYKTWTDSRNYNGTAGFQAYEAGALKDFLINHKSNGGKTLLIDLHGWENSLIGDQEILDYYYPNFSYATKKYGQYGQQYLISWARSDLGAQSALIELPGWIHNMQDVSNNDLYNKYISSSIEMLKNMSISFPRRLKAKFYSNNEITDREQFDIAFAGLIKNEIPTDEEIENYKKQQPTKSGAWIEKNSQNKILSLINEMTNLKYEIDENNYLNIKEKQENNKNNEYDDFIQKLIKSNKLYILGQTGRLYFKDIVTKQVTVDLYEDLEPYQTYNYTKNENKYIIDITTNTKNKLDKKEIMNSLIDLLK